jgi:molybdopterin synthase sulfur carrier subunit
VTVNVRSATVRVRYFAGARAAAGVEEERIELPADSTVHDLVTALCARHGDGLSRVLTASSFLLDGVAVRNRGVTLDNGVGVDVLPPFAGG